MPATPFNLPEKDTPLPDPGASDSSIHDLLTLRRSTPIKMMDPASGGPDDAQTKNLIQTAMRVPDHRMLGPWRTLIFRGEARQAFGQILRKRYGELHPDAKEKDLTTEENRLLRAPVCVSVISSPDMTHKTPVWEQELSAGALCMNLLYAAHASGFAACWLTEWWAFDEGVNQALGLSETERVAGHIFIGQSAAQRVERARPDTSERISFWES